jgi:RNA polymerase sigma-70 factor, ECF subfamily
VTTLLSGRSQQREPLDDDVDLERDRALVARAQSGDQAAFDDLYLRYNRRLHRFCLRRLRDVHEAEDVTQEAFTRAWRALPNFGGDRRFYPWLSVIASHLCTDALRRRTRTTPVAEFHQADLASTEDGGEELVVSAVDGEIATQAFARLSDRHQRILMLREESGWSYQRIADHEGVGITAVETLLWRARQALKREFASLAGSDGRIAAWMGGLVSMASLRRLLRLLQRGARHLAGGAGPGPVMALGSAAAATAMVVTASLHPPSASAPTRLPATTHSAAFIPALPNPTGSDANTGSPSSTGSSGAGASAPTAGSSSPATPSGGAATTPGLGAVDDVGNGLAGVTQQVSQGAGAVVTGIVGTATQLLSPLSTVTGAAASLGSTLGSTLQTTGSSAATLGSDAVTGVTQTVGTVPGVPSGASGATTSVGTTVSGTVDTTVNKASSVVGNLLGGL